ncbi:TPA: enoyl-CoA hydratase-related protein [Burkholderia cepacia]|uniref:enoyl-CoA hydratase-related protein n=1 Tax=Burkholderia cepacia TaxID=292 RepID=UPI00285E6A4F|nr:hypothetical protein [Burkholderia cepacia ATCC 25416]HDV6370269.1 hypothetical protein [Burkholderia cepacia]
MALLELRNPVIAAVNGSRLGTALILFGSRIDICIAGEIARFGFTEIRYGLSGGVLRSFRGCVIRSRIRR